MSTPADAVMAPDPALTVLAALVGSGELFEVANAAGLEGWHFGDKEDGRLYVALQRMHAAGDELSVRALAGICHGAVSESKIRALAKACVGGPRSSVLLERSVQRLLVDASKRRMIGTLRAAIAQISEAGNMAEIESAYLHATADGQEALSPHGPQPKTASEVAGLVKQLILTPNRRIPTGIRKLDFVLGGGLELGRMISLIGRYKIGKTTLLSTVGYNIAYGSGGLTPRKVLAVTLERGETDVEAMNAARSLGINARELERHFPRHASAFAAYAEAPERQSLLYHHSAGATIEEVVQVITNAKRVHDIDVATIDYYQVIYRPAKARMVDHLINVDQTLSRLAGRLGIAIVLAAQADAEGQPRDCKGLLHSAAANFTLRRSPDHPDAWLENIASNYIEQRDAGSPKDPCLRLNTSTGPFFESV